LLTTSVARRGLARPTTVSLVLRASKEARTLSAYLLFPFPDTFRCIMHLHLHYLLLSKSCWRWIFTL
jgi:hypothetical protein